MIEIGIAVGVLLICALVSRVRNGHGSYYRFL